MVGLIVFVLSILPPQLAAVTCESLAELKLPDTTITSVASVDAGQFRNSSSSQQAAKSPYRNLPPFCRVQATLRPTSDSEIKIEVWLPEASDWNGKFEALGNGGWSGNVPVGSLAGSLARKYAAAGTDTGHTGGRGEFALGHPEKLVDFAYRSVHLMTLRAKEVIKAYYGSGPKYSYWNGCSSGGKQGLKEAQMFPDDYDGIVAGAPANHWTGLLAGDIWTGTVTLKDPANYLSKEKYELLHNAALAACDESDGVKDGLINNPPHCRFDPKVLECKGEEGPACLTAPQVDAARKIYQGARNSKTGRQIYPGLAPGSELGWGPLTAGPKPFQIPVDHLMFVVYKDPNWDWKTFDLDRDFALAEKIDNGLLKATNPNLKAFFERGGKLVQYHGWNDQLIAPENSINYYESVAKKLGGRPKVDVSYRLFMEPGVTHCAGGDGPFIPPPDWTPILEKWVEEGKAPDGMVASHRNGGVDRTRPLCRYPQVARYKGSGSVDEAENFVCFADGK